MTITEAAYHPTPGVGVVSSDVERASVEPINVSTKMSLSFPAEGNQTNDEFSYMQSYNENYQRLVNISVLTSYGIIITVGLLGNALVIFSILRNYRRISFTSMMLCSLAFADFLFVAVFTPINLYAMYHHDWEFGPVGCQIIALLWFLSPASSAMMLLVISAERYLVIIHPLQAKAFFTKKRGLIIVSVTWIIALLLSLVSVPFTKYSEIVYEGETYRTCNRNPTTEVGHNLKMSFFIICLYVVPLMGMLFCNIRVIVTLYRSSHVTKSLQSVRSLNKGNGTRQSTAPSRQSCGDTEVSSAITQSGVTTDNTTSYKWPSEGDRERKSGGKRKSNANTSLQERKRVMVLLGILVVMYAVLWGPLVCYMIVSRVRELDHHTATILPLAFNILAISNSAFNPVVYALMSRSFRQIIKAAFSNCACKFLCCEPVERRFSTLRSYQFASTRERGSSLSNSRDATQLTQYSLRPQQSDGANKRTNGIIMHTYTQGRINNVP